MFAPPPQLLTTTITSTKSKILLEFYEDLGMLFNESTDNFGNINYTYIFDKTEFQIQATKDIKKATTNLRLKFLIDEIDDYLNDIESKGGRILKESWSDSHYQYIIIADPDGNTVELITPK